MSKDNERRYKRDTTEKGQMQELQADYDRKYRRWQRMEDDPSRPPMPKKPAELTRFEQTQKILELARSVNERKPVEAVKEEIEQAKKIRRHMRECRKIVGPTGETVYIPKHAAVGDIYQILVKEYGFDKRQVSGIFAMLRILEKNPDTSITINGIRAEGLGNPLRVISDEEIVRESEERKKTEVKDGKTITIESPEVIAARQSLARKLFAERMRADVQRRREEEAIRKKQDEKLEEQMESILEDERKEKASFRTKMSVAAVVCCVAVLFNNAANISAAIAKKSPFLQDITKPTEGLTPLTTIPPWETPGISYLEENLVSDKIESETPIPVTTPTEAIFPDDGYEYQSFYPQIPSINKISAGLNEESNLYQTLLSYSNNDVTSGKSNEISSYEQFEQAWRENSDILYSSGPVYYANFARQVVKSMLMDKYDSDRVKATYEKTGDQYEFYVRYYQGNNVNPTSIEGKIPMTRDEKGRLQTDKWHVLPMELYETLALIGEFAENSEKEFDINKYATQYTNGNVELAKQELREKMEFGWDCLGSLIEDRVKADAKAREEFEASID